MFGKRNKRRLVRKPIQKRIKSYNSNHVRDELHYDEADEHNVNSDIDSDIEFVDVVFEDLEDYRVDIADINEIDYAGAPDKLRDIIYYDDVIEGEDIDDYDSISESQVTSYADDEYDTEELSDTGYIEGINDFEDIDDAEDIDDYYIEYLNIDDEDIGDDRIIDDGYIDIPYNATLNSKNRRINNKRRVKKNQISSRHKNNRESSNSDAQVCGTTHKKYNNVEGSPYKKRHRKDRRVVSSNKEGNILRDKKKTSIMDRVVIITGVLVMIIATLTFLVYDKTRIREEQIASMAIVGEELAGIGIVGEDTLRNIAQYKAQSEEAEVEETVPEYEEVELENDIHVTMSLSSVLKDLKIKFFNKNTNKLIPNVSLQVEITDSSNKTFNKIDDDKDGIIYLKDIVPGEYSVRIAQDTSLKGYIFDTSTKKVTVKEKLDYKVVDLAGEVKDGTTAQAKKEDTAGGDTVVEGTLVDTVAWVDSTKTEVTSQESYVEVPRADVVNPNTGAGISRSYINLAKLEGSTEIELNSSTTLNVNPDANNGESGVTILSWASANDSIATVDGTGKVTGISSGSVVITVTYNITKTDGTTVDGKIDTFTIKVNDVAPTPTPTLSPTPTPTPTPTPVPIVVESIKISVPTLALEIGKTNTLTATVMPTTLTNKNIKWTTDKSDIVSVNSAGLVTGLKVGTANVTATSEADSTKAVSCAVTVLAKTVSVIDIKLDKTSMDMNVGATATLKSTINPSDASNNKITWSSGDANIATVDGTGVVTAKKEGKTTITVKTDDGGKIATCQINVKAVVSGPLKDKNGNRLYVLNGSSYVEAVATDYNKNVKLYKKVNTGTYKYTGWQTIDNVNYYFDANGNKVTGEQVISGAKYVFASDGALQQGSGNLGIDVSRWNGKIDWVAVKNSGISYAIIRCGYRGYSQGSLFEDSMFRTNMQGAINAGLKVGVYYFTQAVNEVEAVEEASATVNMIRKYKISYPVFLDVETSAGGGSGRADGLDSGTRTRIVQAYCNTISNSGYVAGVYANKSWLETKLNAPALGGYKIWLAQYNTAPTYRGAYNIWQYTSKGRVNGISGNVDMNLSYMGY